MTIPIYKPFLPAKSKKYAIKALEDSWLTNHNYNTEVESMLSEMLGVKHVLLICNGTAAMHLVAKGLKYKYPQVKNIIVPNMVYVAAWNAFLFDKEFDIHQVRTDKNTWNFNIDSVIEKIDNNSAILAVHNLGNPVNIPEIQKRTNAPIIEDSCEAFGGKFNNGKSAVTGGLVSALSFFGNKNITSGEGGAVVTDDDDIAQYLERLRGQGQTDIRYIHDLLGYNYRMTNIQAAILRGQIDCVDEIVERKLEIWNRYNNSFGNREDIKIQKTDDGSIHSKWMYGVMFINRETSFNYKQEFFNNRGIEIRPMFYTIGTHNHLNTNKNVFMNYDKVGYNISKNTIMLPSYPELTKEDQEKVIKAVNDFASGVQI